MKNFINFFYNLNIEHILLEKNNYYFYSDNYIYIFQEYNMDYVSLEKTREIIKKNNISSNIVEIIENKDKKLVTIIDNKQYCLLRFKNSLNRELKLEDIINRNEIKIDQSIKIINWKELWEKKIDFLEEKYKNNTDNDLENISFYYYIGLAENAIQYINETIENFKPNSLDSIMISHKRIKNDISLIDYYNPTTIIFDHKVRDIAEYIKNQFINNSYNSSLFIEIMEKIELSDFGANLLFARLLFPCFYFDELDNKKNTYINKMFINSYELFLEEALSILSKKYNMITIEWIKKI